MAVHHSGEAYLPDRLSWVHVVYSTGDSGADINCETALILHFNVGYHCCMASKIDSICELLSVESLIYKPVLCI